MFLKADTKPLLKKSFGSLRWMRDIVHKMFISTVLLKV